MSKQYLQALTIPDAHPTDIFAIAATPSHLLTASGGSSIKVYRTSNRTIHADSAEEENPYPLVQTLEHAHKLGCHHLCASADGAVAASVGFAGEIKIWAYRRSEGDVDGGEWHERGEISVGAVFPVAAKEQGIVTDILLGADTKQNGTHWASALSADGQYLALTTLDGRIDVYDTAIAGAASGMPTERLAQYETKGSFGMAVDISPNGEMTASGHQNGGIYIFNNSTRRLAHSLTGLIQPVRSVRFSPANRYLAAAGDARIIAVYDASSGQQVANFTGHASWITSLDWNFSGELLLSGGYDGKVKVWSIERRQCVATQTESDKCLWCVRWLYHAPTARNEVFVTAGAGRTLAFYREASGT